MSVRTGSHRAALSTVETRATLGRLIVCGGCGDHVDVVEIRVTPNATGSSMRADLCGDCQPRARELEPVVDLEAPA